jgi:PAX-interacting protein 1
MRDIHPSVSPQEKAEELNSKGHEVRNIINVKHRVSKEPLPLPFVYLEPNDNNKEIYNIQFLYDTKIKVEPPRKKRDIIQRTRCQDYGHSKTYCSKPYYCVKCAKQHDSKTYTKSKDTPASCALCKGSHPANYKGCTVYKDLLNAKNKHIPRRVTAQTTYYITNPHMNRPQDINTCNRNQNSMPTYAQIASPNRNNSNNDLHNKFSSFLLN